MSMAAGEYISVSSQRDTEHADLAIERAALEAEPDVEEAELAAIYRARGLSPGLAAAVAANRRDFEARFEGAQLRFAAGQLTEAMDELLEIIMRDKAWNGELARKTYVAILELMTKPVAKPAAGDAAKGTLELTGKAAVTPADPVLDQYRRKLSMALF